MRKSRCNTVSRKHFSANRLSRQSFRGKVAPIILLLPLAFLLAILLFGFLYGFLQSFGLLMPGKFAQSFTFEYYEKVLSSDGLFQSVLLSVYYAATSTVIATTLAIVLSYAMVTTGHDRGFMWSVIKFPMFLPWTVTAMITIDLFGGGGFVESIGESLGWSWLANFSSVFLHQPAGIGIIAAFVWAEIPFITYFIITIMSNISASLGEAARTMGATSLRAFLNVTLPLCAPIIKNVFLIVIVSLFSAYEIPLLLGVTRPTGISVLLYQTYSHASLADRPEVMAMSMVVLLMTVLFIIVFHAAFQRPRKSKQEQGEAK